MVGQKLYVIPAGTHCQVKKANAKGWRRHRTREDLSIYGCQWRNRTHYGFLHAGWDIKVAVGDVREATAKVRDRHQTGPSQAAPADADGQTMVEFRCRACGHVEMVYPYFFTHTTLGCEKCGAARVDAK